MKYSIFCGALALIGFGILVDCPLVQASPSESDEPPMAAPLKSRDYASCLIQLDNGGPLVKVPLQFWGMPTCDTAKPQLQSYIHFDISYPAMTVGTWSGAMDRYLAHDLGEGVPMKEFSARIIWLFFADETRSPENSKVWHGPEPQVWQMNENAKNVAKLENAYPVPRIEPAEIPGLRRIKLADDLKPSAAALVHLKAIGWMPPPPSKGSLMEMPNADYELIAGCDEFACQGHVQLKESHLQYHFFIPFRAREHMADFIAATNRLVNSWIKN